MATKIVKLYYNGELGYKNSIADVHKFFQIQMPLKDWINFKNDDGYKNDWFIYWSWSLKTSYNLGYIDKDQEPLDKFNDINNDAVDSPIQGNEPMPWPISLYVPANQINRQILLNQSNVVLANDATSDFAGPAEGFEDEGIQFSTNLGATIASLHSWHKDTLTDGTNVNLDQFNEDQFGNSSTQTRSSVRDYMDQTETPFDYKQDWEPTYKEQPKFTVWCWPKALNEKFYAGAARDREGNIVKEQIKKAFDKNTVFDLTPFVQSVSVNQQKDGGNFQINLAPVVARMACTIDAAGEQVGAGTWFIDPQTYEKYKNEGVEQFLFKTHINRTRYWADGADEPPTKSERSGRNTFQSQRYDGNVWIKRGLEEDETYRVQNERPYYWREDFFFTNLLSENDIIFINFHEDFRDGKARVEYTDDFYCNVDELQYKTWEMIGLIDTNSTSFNAEATDISINLSGRDLMKLLIEDGSFFFQKSYANPDQDQTAFNNTDLPKSGDDVNALNQVIKNKGTTINRLVDTGLIEVLFNQEARNIGFVMNLLISQLANIEICPSEVFGAFDSSDRSSKFQVEVMESVDENKNETEE